MHFLLSNDDGITARGIKILSEWMQQKGDVTIVAPDQDRSGASNSLTLTSPVRIREIAERTYRVNGTPTDCVHIALTGLLDSDPDMVISGINAGANLGDDATVHHRNPIREDQGLSLIVGDVNGGNAQTLL